MNEDGAAVQQCRLPERLVRRRCIPYLGGAPGLGACFKRFEEETGVLGVCELPGAGSRNIRRHAPLMLLSGLGRRFELAGGMGNFSSLTDHVWRAPGKHPEDQGQSVFLRRVMEDYQQR